ncbi:alpha/beta hydrolase domain-containing protein [Daedaleopsis nitida]|nr:alpha/beta hydrolase domain-containing protein [Daedaleopsis nitida]
MEAVANLPDTAITELHVLVGLTRDVFMPLLEKRREEIESYPQRTFKYGSTDRHQLDVYYPDPKAIPNGKIPVLFFVYGGGFIGGDRKFAAPYNLGYSNVGMFFAQRGIMTVIADYRLVPHVKFPQPVEDIRDAITWFIANSDTVIAASPAGASDLNKASLGKIFAMGHSAGANHITSLFLSPTIIPPGSPIRAMTGGLIPQGGPYRFSFVTLDLPPGILEAYYGSQEATLAKMPFTLLEKADQELLDSLPEVFMLWSEHEPAGLLQTNKDFQKALEERTGKRVKSEAMEGHNHFREKWGEFVAEWVKARV